jgi:hypothetical protein
MEPLFLTCAVLGGTVMVAQFLMSLLGWGHHEGGFDHDLGADGGDSTDSAHGVEHDAADQHPSTSHAHPNGGNSTWFFGVITFRTVVAALTFFGLSGMASLSAQFEQPTSLLIALASGAVALYAVHAVMQMLYRLRSDGTQRISHALGREATVYLSIPAHGQGAGKVHLSMQNRLLEFEAITSGERVPSGTRVVVTEIAGPSMLKVAPAPEMARNE